MTGLSAVLKVGGSLSRGAGLPDLCLTIRNLAERHPLLVVPGGGGFADQVREIDRRFHLEPTAAHSMALLAMDQCGYLLGQLVPGSFLSADPDSACNSAERGSAAILLPSALVIRENPLPHSWQVTSDSIAAWVAHRVHSEKLILLKDVDGLLAPGGTLIEELDADQLKEQVGGVDEYLSIFLSSVPVDTWIVNGLQPWRLSELIEAAHTIGTHIKPARAL
jgi:5-(aminomethyl)-3-furanmethanol phosphate kinase